MDPVLRIRPIRDASLGFGYLPRCLFWRWVQGPLWRLEEDHVFTLAVPRCTASCGPCVFTIPSGYEFDKASIPPFFWGKGLNYIPDGLCTVPALEHDFLCDLLNGGSDWLKAHIGTLPAAPPAWMVHEHFRLRLHQAGVRPGKAQAMGLTVALFGPQGKAWPWVKALALLLITLSTLYFWS